jgi:NAD-specific glutamate dehydrogenase
VLHDCLLAFGDQEQVTAEQCEDLVNKYGPIELGGEASVSRVMELLREKRGEEESSEDEEDHEYRLIMEIQILEQAANAEAQSRLFTLNEELSQLRYKRDFPSPVTSSRDLNADIIEANE